jgi:hypothetical protein
MTTTRRLVDVTFKRNSQSVPVHWYEDQPWSEVKNTEPFNGYNVLLRGKIVKDDETPASMELSAESVVHLVPCATSVSRKAPSSAITQAEQPVASQTVPPANVESVNQPPPQRPSKPTETPASQPGFFARIKSFFSGWW